MTKYRDPDRACLLMLPKSRDGRAWLYIVRFEDGAIKIGQTWRPRIRATQHMCSNVQARGVHFHLCGSVPSVDACRIEAAALRSAALIGARIGTTERFTGLVFADALRCVRGAIDLARVDSDPERLAVRFREMRQTAGTHNVAVGVYGPVLSIAVH